MAEPAEIIQAPSSDWVALNLKPGGRLGKYHLKKCLGTGGSCEVWKARDTVEGIWVALKIPQAGLDGRRDNKTLLHEIRTVARLRHPHILSVKNADIIDGHAVLATELSVGTLYDHSKPMSARRIISIISQVLDGLSYAHRHRLVHCDVTPANIFLFPDGRAALGDFGICFLLKGRVTTIDEYGTPGYVAPEQAYGRPTYRSDCFSAGLILYEYITGILPRWPFRWPPKGHKRLLAQTGTEFVKFVRKSLSVDPAKRFASAEQMLSVLREATPWTLRKDSDKKQTSRKKLNWLQMRQQTFIERYGKVLRSDFKCIDCDEPLAESMQICPWCASSRNRFDTRSRFSHICPRCHKGISPQWRFCPWCYGPGFEPQAGAGSPVLHYHARCSHCDGKLLRFMRYCPWCHRKVRQNWQVRPFPEICSRCRWPVDSQFWYYCPWCKQNLTT